MVGYVGVPVRAAVVAGVGLLLVGGCSSAGGDPDGGPPSLGQIAESARDRGYAWQAGVLDDGDVTLAEYDEGHRRNLECLTAAGMTYTEPVRVVADGFRWDYAISWTGLDDETGMRESAACFDDNLGELELAMSAWGDWQTDAALLAEVRTCVADAGFDADPAARNYRDLWLSASEQGLSQQVVASCVSTAMARVHPGVGYALGF